MSNFFLESQAAGLNSGVREFIAARGTTMSLSSSNLFTERPPLCWKATRNENQSNDFPRATGGRSAESGTPWQRNIHDSAIAGRGTSTFCIDFCGHAQYLWAPPRGGPGLAGGSP